MEEREYFLIFQVIIYAGIITQFLLGWSKMIQERGQFKVYWLHILISAHLFLATVQMYYASKSLLDLDRITNTFTFLIFGLIPLASVFIMTFLLFPKTNINVDFKGFMRNNFRVPFAILSIIPLCYAIFGNFQKAMLKDVLSIYEYLSLIPHFLFLTMLLVLIFNKSLKYFSFVGILFISLMIYFVIVV